MLKVTEMGDWGGKLSARPVPAITNLAVEFLAKHAAAPI
jgi:hypothetical protein